MVLILLILLALFSFTSVFADIPDNVLSSDSYCEIDHPGDDYLEDVIFSEADSVISCFGYTISGDNTDFWVLSIDFSGVILNRKTLPFLKYNDDNDITDTFLELDDGNALLTGREYRNEQITGLAVLLDPQCNEIWRRNDWYNDHSSFSTALLTPDSTFLLAGWTGEEIAPGVIETNVLLAIVDYDGSRIIGTELLADGDQMAHYVFVTGSRQVIVVGTVIQPGQNDTDAFFCSLNFKELL